MPNPASQTVPAIDMRNVTVGALHDPSTTSVEGVNWTVQAGEFWVIGGLHGSGKTDFLSLTAGLIGGLTGEYRMFGRLMPIPQGDSLEDRLRVGLVFDGGQMIRSLSVRQNVSLPLCYHRELEPVEAEEKVQAMLKWTGLEEVADSHHDVVSGSVRKRVGLARALIMQPDLVVIDNPLGNLDRRETAWWLRFLRELSVGTGSRAGRAATVIVSAGDLGPWRGVATHFAVLKARRLLTVGTAAELGAQSDPAVQELISEALIIS